VLETLVVYFQMETRSTLRVKLLKLFIALSEVDTSVLPILQDSQLPLELVRDATSNACVKPLRSVWLIHDPTLRLLACALS
jgi:hypothetical protein